MNQIRFSSGLKFTDYNFGLNKILFIKIYYFFFGLPFGVLASNKLLDEADYIYNSDHNRALDARVPGCEAPRFGEERIGRSRLDGATK